ncbi:unnamed protein product, partial [Didymodactylos carnosus]
KQAVLNNQQYIEEISQFEFIYVHCPRDDKTWMIRALLFPLKFRGAYHHIDQFCASLLKDLKINAITFTPKKCALLSKKNP